MKATIVEKTFCPRVIPAIAMPFELSVLRSSLMVLSPCLCAQNVEHVFVSLYNEHLFVASPKNYLIADKSTLCYYHSYPCY